MANKEFKRKFMHPTRRKLSDMVRTGGDYDKETTIGWEGKKKNRKVGEVWEDEHSKYEKLEDYTIKTGKNHKSIQEIRKYLEDLNKCKNPKCEHIGKFGPTNKKLIRKTGFCIGCNKTMERELRINGVYEDYEKYKIYGNMIADGLLRIDAIKQDIDDLKQTYDHIGEDGKVIETFTLPRPVDEMKEEMRGFIENSMKEVTQLKEMRQECFNKVKEKNYEHIL